jgi:transglutaminase-like putative cysteine protease
VNTEHAALTEHTAVFDYEHQAVTAFVDEAGCYRATKTASAVERLHDVVRDTIDYDVFDIPLHDGLRASEVAELQAGFCLHKSILFVAGCRNLGVPAVLCSDVVTNHVADPAMLDLVGGEEFLHWYAQIHLNGRWVKAAPIFNTLLCSVYGLEVLRFNPSTDSIRQPYRAGTRMQYQGAERRYANPAMAELVDAIATKHPRMVTASGRTPTSRQLTDSLSSSTGEAAHHVDG